MSTSEEEDRPDTYNPVGALPHIDTDGNELTGNEKYRGPSGDLQVCQRSCEGNSNCRIILYDYNNQDCVMGTGVGDKISDEYGNLISMQAKTRENVIPPPRDNWTKDSTTKRFGTGDDAYLPHPDGTMYSGNRARSLEECKDECESIDKCVIIRHDTDLNCLLGGSIGVDDTNENNTNVSSYQRS